MFIYLIVNRETGKYYVGQHKGADLRRYLQKKLSQARYYKGSSHLYNSMKKHLPYVWSIHALRSDIQTREELDQTERDFIKFLRAQDSEFGYNICRGGEGFSGTHPEGVRQKMSSAHKEQWQEPEFRDATVAKIRENYQLREQTGGNLGFRWEEGHEVSDETKARLSESRKENWQDPEYRAMASAALQKRYEGSDLAERISASLMGHSISDESRAKISLAKTGSKASDETKAKMSLAHKGRLLPQLRKRFCLNGHDTDICGRIGTSGHGRCNECARLHMAAKRRLAGASPYGKDGFCKHGHDKNICGRDSKNYCLECKRLSRLVVKNSLANPQ